MRDCDIFALCTVLGVLLATSALFLPTDMAAKPRLAGQLLAAGILGAVLGIAVTALALRK